MYDFSNTAITLSATWTYAEIDVGTLCPGEIVDVRELRDKVVTTQPLSGSGHAALLSAPGKPALDESNLDQFVGKEQRRKELLQLPTSGFFLCCHRLLLVAIGFKMGGGHARRRPAINTWHSHKRGI